MHPVGSHITRAHQTERGSFFDSRLASSARASAADIA
jgi:hypothetical protein